MRRTSVSLPTDKIAFDPHEKPARYGSHAPKSTKLERFTAWMSQAKQTRWIKAAAVLSAVFFLFYYFSPQGVDLYRGASSPSDGQVPSDSTYGTSRCTRSSSHEKPIVQYVMMIDAGSTGSRIHIYKFNNCGATPELESEVFKQTKKIDGQSSGLSAYPDDPEGAAHSLDSLMEEALSVVPDKLKACSPIAVKATAGLRLLGPEKSQRILDAVRKHLEQDYPFPVLAAEEGGVAIMDGSDEGVYAWITTNYLLGNIGMPEHEETAAVFDLGGGSTQIVFEPNYKGLTQGGIPTTMAEGDHKYDLDFGGRHFTLYQHSHLGYGLMSAREAILKELVDDLLAANKDATTTAWAKAPVVNPCFAVGMQKTVKVKLGDDHPLGAQAEFNMTGPTKAAPAQCRNLAERILRKEAECKLAPCSFNGVHQPSIAKTFSKEAVYFLSYFFDRTQPLGMPESFTLREMHELANTVCSGPAAWDVFSAVPGALEELDGRPEHCMDLNFMLALVHTGYEMPIDREVRIAKKIKDNELGWCLGASLPLLSKGSGWACKVTEVHR
ncbi:nucleoside diphosphatase gda1 [Grosmannia clavigera kw1407]|uniref:guanosine-diphosphatase n=1 Tax=Grosmannia clavigera (strain kw1407 / UAMH 11150) TaxID=655863 RepID=F0X983_GROCL|nr:nucleoside diphosphatase gda1 [Grosmannia clavigera kw1407]EFX05558.1 nucleoside diphosphatase gda1 [Grosmannia clavigera kw1407]